MQLVADTIYIGLAERAGLQPGNNAELDVELYQQAVKLAVGNIADYGDNKILLPSRNMTLDQFESTIDDLSMEQINEMGGFADANLMGRNGQPRTVTPESMLDKLKSGEAELRQGSEFGQYQVYFDGRPVANATGTIFILDFSEK
jgi:hypothetical protein